MLAEELKALVEYDLYNCIGCNSCMEACPVSKDPKMTIAELNSATMSDEPPKGPIYDFAVNCVQCGRCVPVCPPGVRRDLLVLYLKYKIKNYPKSYESYVSLKRPKLSGPKKLALLALNRLKKKRVGRFYSKLDNPDLLRHSDLLFYPGCYIFNEVCKKTAAILDYLGLDYEVLAGYTTCCGWPQLLQGRPRTLLNALGEWKELPNNKMDSMCCYYYNFEADSQNKSNRLARIDEVKSVAEIMVTDCITCHEVYAEKMKESGLVVIDFNELIYHCIKDQVKMIEDQTASPADKEEENVDLEGVDKSLIEEDLRGDI